MSSTIDKLRKVVEDFEFGPAADVIDAAAHRAVRTAARLAHAK
jgi:hypothetical protein